MGSAWSVSGGYADTYSYWTHEEKEENDAAKKYQSTAEKFIVEHIFYGVPVRISKKTANPTSPLWFEIEEGILDKYLALDNGTLRDVPSYCTVDGKGLIHAVFGLTGVEYDFHVKDIESAKAFAKKDASLGVCPAPSPPILVLAESNALFIEWKLPQPPGIAQIVEVQYAIFNAAKFALSELQEIRNGQEDIPISDVLNFDQSGGVLQWSALVTTMWSKPNFCQHSLVSLRVGMQVVFRLRYQNFYGWSFYSPVSAIMETLPGPPCAPIPPIIGGIFTDSVQLFWYSPSITNGRPVTEYLLRGRAIGDEFVDLYRGPHTSHLVSNLFPQACYTFELAAINEIGQSKYSNSVTVITLPARNKDSDLVHAGFINPAALQLRDAWVERWDPKTQQYFYFNRITGTRQLEKPECWTETDAALAAGESGKKFMSPEAAAKEEEIKFRTKRFRITMMLHKRAKNPGASTPVPSSGSTPIRRRVTTVGDAVEEGAGNSDSSVATTAQPSTPGSFSRGMGGDVYAVELRRQALLEDAIKVIGQTHISSLHRRIKVTFAGEEGIDSGGLGKEAFLLISKQAASWATAADNNWMQMCVGKTSRGLFFSELPRSKEKEKKSTPAPKSKGNQLSAFPFPSSATLPPIARAGMDDPKSFAGFLGRFFGKALFDRQMIDFPLSPLLLRHMIGQSSGQSSASISPTKMVSTPQTKASNKVATPTPATTPVSATPQRVPISAESSSEPSFEELLDDVQSLDKTLHQSLVWMMNNSIKDVIYETFSAVTPFGEVVPLCANGDKKEVTDENKAEYARLLVQWVTNYSVQESLVPFLAGFNELVPKGILADAGITTSELDLMLNGKVNIDVEELRPYVIYQPASSLSQFGEGHWLVMWLWQVVVEFSSEQRSDWLQFFTGCSKVPLDGFDPPLNITEGSDMVEDSLPKAHTCFNQLVIPPYSSFDKMKEKFLFAIKNTDGFALS